MSDCEKYQEMISVMLDGELCPEYADALHAHLEGCAECKAVYEAFSTLEATLENDLAEPPAELASGVMLRIRGSASPKKRRTRVLRYSAAAACVVIVAAAALGSGLLSGAKTAAPESAEMAAVTENGAGNKMKSRSLAGGPAAGAPAECVPGDAADGGIFYGMTDAMNGAYTSDCAEAECTDEAPEEAAAAFPEPILKSEGSAGVPADASVPMTLCYEEELYQYAGHTAVLPEGAQLADAETLTDFYSDSAVLGKTPETGLLFRTETELFVPDGNGEWNRYSLEK